MSKTDREQSQPLNTLLVERFRDRVIITVRCQDDAAAVALYQSVCTDAREGCVLIDVETVPRPTLNAEECG